MQLYYIQGSPFARLVHVLLRELGLTCHEIEIQEFPPPTDYFAVDPLGEVPVLDTHLGRLFPLAARSGGASARWRDAARW